jgi:glycoside/pentoside/hexuronide:cation symporter, GPH family
MPDTHQTLGNKEKLAYGLGDLAANLIFQTQITFLMYFYTNVLGIAASTAGTILLISRIVDAANDPIIGALADRGHSRWGRFRPWVLWTAIPLAAALILCFWSPPFSSVGKVIWAVATYNLLMILYAANNIPYCALSGVMTSESSERTSLASWRFVCAMAAAFVVNVFTIDLVEFFGGGNEAWGYPLTMMLWGAIAIIFFVVTFAFTKERVISSKRRESTLRQDVSSLLRNGPWMALFLIAVLIYIQLALRSGTMLYYFNYYLNVGDVFPWIDNFGVFNGVGLAFTIVGVILAGPLTAKLGKRTTFQISLLVSSLLMASIALVPADSFALLLSIQVMLNLVFGPTIPILWSMMADVADYGEWKFGRRSTALAFASIIFGLKLGFGIGGWLNGALLEHFGYSATEGVSPSAARGIALMVSVCPAMALLTGAAVTFFYNLDDKLLKQIENTLASRRSQFSK